MAAISDAQRQQRKRQRVGWFHRYLVNPLTRRLGGLIPGQAVLETTGRISGQPRRTPVGGRVESGSFWMVSNHGPHAQYVRNIMADPRVRVQLRGRWHTGTARLQPDDDPHQRLATLPAYNSAMMRLMGTDLPTIRVELDQHRADASRSIFLRCRRP